MFRKLAEVKQDQKQNPQLKHDENGRFNDKDLDRTLIGGCNHVVGAFGGQNTSDVLRNIEINDIMALVRGDQFHSQEATHYNPTKFGMEDSESVATTDYGPLNGRKLISRHLSSVFTLTGVYAIFPCTLPNEAWKNL
ncbi:unnamed protein product, partial [Rotaria sp. Silwood1]